MLTNPYEHVHDAESAKFNSICPSSVLYDFRAYFPRRGVIQSFVNHIIYETLNSIKHDPRIQYADANNEQLLERTVKLLRLSLAGRTDLTFNRLPTTLAERRVLSTL